MAYGKANSCPNHCSSTSGLIPCVVECCLCCTLLHDYYGGMRLRETAWEVGGGEFQIHKHNTRADLAMFMRSDTRKRERVTSSYYQMLTN